MILIQLNPLQFKVVCLQSCLIVIVTQDKHLIPNSINKYNKLNNLICPTQFYLALSL